MARVPSLFQGFPSSHPERAMGFVLLAIGVVLVLWFVGGYNSLIVLRNQVASGWKQIDVQLKRRHDLIPNLISTVKGVMNFESETLEAVISARNKAIQFESSGAGVGATADAYRFEKEGGAAAASTEQAARQTAAR